MKIGIKYDNLFTAYDRELFYDEDSRCYRQEADDHYIVKVNGFKVGWIEHGLYVGEKGKLVPKNYPSLFLYGEPEIEELELTSVEFREDVCDGNDELVEEIESYVRQNKMPVFARLMNEITESLR